MPVKRQTYITVLWVVLMAATILSFAFGHGYGFHDHRYASVAIIVIAFVKVRFVVLDFMEVRNAPAVMRIMSEIWVFTVASALSVIFWLGTDPAAQAAWPHITGL